MDRRITSLGLLLDGLTFLSPFGLAMIGLAWYSDGSFAVQALFVSAGLFLTTMGLVKRGQISVSSAEALILACAFLVVLIWYEFGTTAMASSPFALRCAQLGDPSSCSIVSTVNLIELLFWPALLTPALTFVGSVLALRQHVGSSPMK